MKFKLVKLFAFLFLVFSCKTKGTSSRVSGEALTGGLEEGTIKERLVFVIENPCRNTEQEDLDTETVTRKYIVGSTTFDFNNGTIVGKGLEGEGTCLDRKTFNEMEYVLEMDKKRFIPKKDETGSYLHLNTGLIIKKLRNEGASFRSVEFKDYGSRICIRYTLLTPNRPLTNRCYSNDEIRSTIFRTDRNYQ